MLMGRGRDNLQEVFCHLNTSSAARGSAEKYQEFAVLAVDVFQPESQQLLLPWAPSVSANERGLFQLDQVQVQPRQMLAGLHSTTACSCVTGRDVHCVG